MGLFDGLAQEAADKLLVIVLDILYDDGFVCPLAAEWENKWNLRQQGTGDWWRPDEYTKIYKNPANGESGKAYPSIEEAGKGVKKHLREYIVWCCCLNYDERQKFYAECEAGNEKDAAIPHKDKVYTISKEHLKSMVDSSYSVPTDKKKTIDKVDIWQRPELTIALCEAIIALCKNDETASPELRSLADEGSGELNDAFKSAQKNYNSSKPIDSKKQIDEEMRPHVGKLLEKSGLLD